MPRKKKVETLVDIIRKSNVAFINHMEIGECEELAGEIGEWLESKAESAESLFNIDEDEDDQVYAIPLDAIGL
jgi:hypothetical protein